MDDNSSDSVSSGGGDNFVSPPLTDTQLVSDVPPATVPPPPELPKEELPKPNVAKSAVLAAVFLLIAVSLVAGYYLVRKGGLGLQKKATEGCTPPVGKIGNDSEGGCCGNFTSVEGNTCPSGDCRSWETCTISNGACASGTSCYDTTGGGTTPAPGQVGCTADGQSVHVTNNTSERKIVRCIKCKGCRGGNLPGCSLDCRIDNMVLEPGETKLCFADVPRPCETTQTDVPDCQSGKNVVVWGGKCCNNESCVYDGPISNPACQQNSDCLGPTPTATTPPAPPTATLIPSPTATNTPTPTGTVVPSPTPTGTRAPTPTPTGTRIPTQTPTSTLTLTPVPTNTPRPTATPIPTTPPGVPTPTPRPTIAPACNFVKVYKVNADGTKTLLSNGALLNAGDRLYLEASFKLNLSVQEAMTVIRRNGVVVKEEPAPFNFDPPGNHETDYRITFYYDISQTGNYEVGAFYYYGGSWH